MIVLAAVFQLQLADCAPASVPFASMWRSLLIVLVLTVPMTRAVEAPADPQVETLIFQLTSGDPVERQDAAKKLVALGAVARPQVFEASRSDDPELRAKAAEILLKLPWYLPDDSPGVRQLLNNYGQLEAERRKQVVRELALLRQHGMDALLRLIVEEPSDEVKWLIAGAVRREFRPAVLERFRKLDTAQASAPLLVSAGHAWFVKDQARGVELFHAAIAREAQRASTDGGELLWAFERIAHTLTLASKHDELAQLLRTRIKREVLSQVPVQNDDEEAPTPRVGDTQTPRGVIDLFALHARLGPLKGFDDDRKTYAAHLGDACVLYALASLYERGGQEALAQATRRQAFAVGAASMRARFDAGDFLLRTGQVALAEAEYKAALEMTAPQPEMTLSEHVNAHFRLAQAANAREDDLAAATHLEKMAELTGQTGGRLVLKNEQQFAQQIHWHRLRTARAKGDRAEMEKRIEELMRVTPENPDITNDLVPILKELGRDKEAAEAFEKARALLEQKMREKPDDPMPRNNMAWLCARCGERKLEALELAKQAVSLMPDNSAYMDTLAEAHFQVGNYEEAVKWEKKVVILRPHDRFLRGQLKRFQEAAAKARKGN